MLCENIVDVMGGCKSQKHQPGQRLRSDQPQLFGQEVPRQQRSSLFTPTPKASQAVPAGSEGLQLLLLLLSFFSPGAAVPCQCQSSEITPSRAHLSLSPGRKQHKRFSLRADRFSTLLLPCLWAVLLFTLS